MKVFTGEINLESKSSLQIVDISERVKDLYVRSGIKDGLLCAFTQHSTSSVMVNENCDRLKSDMIKSLERLVPRGGYEHDDISVDNRPNGHSHVMSMLMSHSVTVPVTKGRLELGRWQSIFFVELDGPRSNRIIKVKVIGD